MMDYKYRRVMKHLGLRLMCVSAELDLSEVPENLPEVSENQFEMSEVAKIYLETAQTFVEWACGQGFERAVSDYESDAASDITPSKRFCWQMYNVGLKCTLSRDGDQIKAELSVKTPWYEHFEGALWRESNGKILSVRKSGIKSVKSELNSRK